MKLLIVLITILLSTGILFAQESNKPIQKQEQIQKKVMNSISDDVKKQLNEAQNSMNQNCEKIKNGEMTQTDVEQYRIQRQEHVRNAIDNLDIPEKTKAQVREAIKKIEQSKEQRAMEFKK